MKTKCLNINYPVINQYTCEHDWIIKGLFNEVVFCKCIKCGLLMTSNINLLTDTEVGGLRSLRSLRVKEGY